MKKGSFFLTILTIALITCSPSAVAHQSWNLKGNAGGKDITLGIVNNVALKFVSRNCEGRWIKNPAGNFEIGVVNPELRSHVQEADAPKVARFAEPGSFKPSLHKKNQNRPFKPSFSNGVTVWDETDSSTSTIYFIRTKNFPHVYGNGVLVDLIQNSRAYNVFADSQFVCALNQHSYIVHELTPGQHNFSVRLNSKKFKSNIVQLILNIEPGKVYYLDVAPSHGKLNSPLQCSVLSDSIGSKLILELEEDKKCKATQE